MRPVATNIRLDADVLKKLKIKAAEEHKSLACLVREAVAEVYGISETRTKPAFNKKDSFFKMIGAIKSGIKDGSTNHDSVIYGFPEKKK